MDDRRIGTGDTTEPRTRAAVGVERNLVQHRASDRSITKHYLHDSDDDQRGAIRRFKRLMPPI